jgi:hypothetical protein
MVARDQWDRYSLIIDHWKQRNLLSLYILWKASEILPIRDETIESERFKQCYLGSYEYQECEVKDGWFIRRHGGLQNGSQTDLVVLVVWIDSIDQSHASDCACDRTISPILHTCVRHVKTVPADGWNIKRDVQCVRSTVIERSPDRRRLKWEDGFFACCEHR